MENEVWRVIKRTKEKYHVPEKIGLDQFEIVSGHAAGADALGEKFAKKNNIKLTVFPADWKKYGKSAGPIRNSQMAKYASDGIGILIAFWNEKSKGTQHMINVARTYRLQEIYVIVY